MGNTRTSYPAGHREQVNEQRGVGRSLAAGAIAVVLVAGYALPPWQTYLVR